MYVLSVIFSKETSRITAVGASSVNGAFQRSNVGSFRQATLAERKLDPQSVIVVDDDEKGWIEPHVFSINRSFECLVRLLNAHF